ncbi:hypothetical protein SNE40_008478 [Patella caerulea]|uniref:Uncharacterized protein n=1 Tax=Patella caerulea TaxID=87958 RepID=A0AAN8K1X7_PATCE
MDKILQIRLTLTPQAYSAEDHSEVTEFCQLVTFNAVSEDEVNKLLQRCPNKSCSLDFMPTWLLKNCYKPLVPTITSIINMSFSEGHVPASLKEAIITPLLKKPPLDADILKNYRPVSNLSFLSKLNERVVAERLKQHMAAHSCLEPLQSVYRSFHSTETALLKESAE